MTYLLIMAGVLAIWGAVGLIACLIFGRSLDLTMRDEASE